MVKDDKTGETVPLEFVEMHQPMRHLKKDGRISPAPTSENPAARTSITTSTSGYDKNGKLEVAEVKMHKVPVQEDGIWTQEPRYTFDGMDFDVTN